MSGLLAVGKAEFFAIRYAHPGSDGSERTREQGPLPRRGLDGGRLGRVPGPSQDGPRLLTGKMDWGGIGLPARNLEMPDAP